MARRGGVVVWIAVLVLGLLLIPVPAHAIATLPTGFALTELSSGQEPYQLTDFAYLPDGGILSTGKAGTVAWVAPDGRSKTIATLPTHDVQDLGLVGIAVAADYRTSREIYLARSVPSGGGFTIRLARWTVTGAEEPTGLTGERVLVELPGDAVVHGITGIVAAPDTTIWVSVGDVSDYTKVDRRALRAQNPDALQGKILHLTREGLGVPGNPFYSPADPASVRSRVYASGFRSPFRLTLDPELGVPVVGDVGWRNWEEVGLVRPGSNHSWPCWEGTQRTPGYLEFPECAGVPNHPPMWAYSHGSGVDQGNSVTGGIVYGGTSYPQQYHGAYFFGDYVTKKLWSLRYDSQGRLVQPPQSPPLGTDVGGPVKFAAAPNGDIVYADIYTGSLRRLTYTAGNSPPSAKAVTRTDPDARLVSFDGTESVDYDGDPLTYQWDFGDGSSAEGVRVEHTYAAGSDRVTASLTVTDPLGASDRTEFVVAPGNHSPDLRFTEPPEPDFAVRDPVTTSAVAQDAEDGALPISWMIKVVHCPQEATCHAHPATGGARHSLTVPFTDHPDSRMELTATATDSAGVSVSKTYVAWPREHRLTLRGSVPAALEITSEGGGYTTMVTEGANVDVVAAAVAADGVSAFAEWDDGSVSRNRALTMGASDITLTAEYAGPIQLRYEADPALRTLLGAATGPEVTDGGVRYRTYEGGRLYWSVATGVRETHGAILRKYLQLGGHSALGLPVTDETVTPDKVGRYNHFSGAQGTGPASIYWTPSIGAHGVWGAIRRRWAALGWELGPMGYPTKDETTTPDRIGRYNHFSKAASIYWTPTTGAHDVYGAIRRRWSALGWERSYLGYPTTGEYAVSGGRRNNFQRGYIVYSFSSKQVTDRRY
ncbi:Glucose/arabinose dehydrogenase, beta-propeller fold [Amycolatopsis marina]|uniref:Glucose/arabinose dehydrogenase, beta-propeller fold n=1 Tax=Amycolatopsis marina TaxID=490629 RepID=A0A1I1BA41_9PSEU|nr:PQQ-dependent sugar dehydrogenase [Amycolatopsis marina]SFB45578.1 Glucose/arabinose dehydrogenase, beta-propeller fold [Amycolatopsis marina]